MREMIIGGQSFERLVEELLLRGFSHESYDVAEAIVSQVGYVSDNEGFYRLNTLVVATDFGWELTPSLDVFSED